MGDEIKAIRTIRKTGPVKHRPVFLTALCLFSFIWFGLMTLLFFAGLFYSNWIAGVTSQYLSAGGYSHGDALLFFGAGFLLHGLSFTGILLIWNLRRTGYYFLGLSCLVIAAYQLMSPSSTIIPTAIYIIFILIFGLFFNTLHPVPPSVKKEKENESPSGDT